MEYPRYARASILATIPVIVAWYILKEMLSLTYRVTNDTYTHYNQQIT